MAPNQNDKRILLRAASETSESHEANQLRYVCQQTYNETDGLSLRFNDLTFHNPWRRSKGEPVIYNDDFTRVLSTSPEHHLDHIQLVTILDKSTRPFEPEQNILSLKCGPGSAIARFCASHPHATIIIRFNWRHIMPTRYIECIDTVAYGLRGSSPFSTQPPIADFFLRVLLKCADLEFSDRIRFTLTQEFEEELAYQEFAHMFDSKAEVEAKVAEARRVHDRGV